MNDGGIRNDSLKTVFITGITGFIGRELAAELHARGYHIAGSTTKDPTALNKNKKEIPGADHIHRIILNKPFDPECFKDVEVVIHGAYTTGPGALVDNVEGTRLLQEAAARAGVKRQLLISSFSAVSSASSDYARAKRALEKSFSGEGSTIVRPGLVIGQGGLFGRMYRMLKSFPALPVLDGGRGSTPVLWIGDLKRAIAEIIERELHGEFNLFNDRNPRLIDLLKGIRAEAGFRTWLVPVPTAPIEVTLKAAEALGARLPVTSENVKGYKANQNAGVPSDLSQLIGAETSWESMIRELISDRGAKSKARMEMETETGVSSAPPASPSPER